MNKTKMFTIILVIVALVTVSTLTLGGCDITGGSPNINITGDIKLSVNSKAHNDNLKLVPQCTPVYDGVTSHKVLGKFSVALMAGEKPVNASEIEIYFKPSDVLLKSNDGKFETIDDALSDYFIIYLYDGDGNAMQSAYSNDNYIGASKLKLNQEYTIKVAFNPTYKNADYPAHIVNELVGKTIKCSINIYARVNSDSLVSK